MESNPLIQIKSNDVIGIRTSNYKYFRDVNESTKRVNLYDLVNDPFENINIAERNPEIVKEFEMRLQIILRQDNLLINENSEGSEAISNELKKMGYT
jgi:arylsulfatase A-like enzyme